MAAQHSGEAPTSDERELVFALCHEIGNLLAASRLEASLLGRAAPADLPAASERLSEISARAGSLLALVRPLLDPDAAPAQEIDPGELLAGLRRGLDAGSDARVTVGAAAGLPAVAVASEVLHHLLLTEVFLGLEAPGRVRVTARGGGGRVELTVAHPAVGGAATSGDALRGPTLARALARALLARHGGRVTGIAGDGATGVVFSLPAAEA